MNLQNRIVDNVRRQSAITARFDQLQKEADRLKDELQRLQGQMDLLSDFVQESEGCSLQELMERDTPFAELVKKASNDGARIINDTQQNPPPDNAPKAAPSPEGTVARTGNKTIAPRENAQPEVDVQRTRNPPRIVITDDPPTPDDPEDD